MEYYITKQLSTSYEKAINRVNEELQKEGFGVVSEIDLHEKFKSKLNTDFRRYKIMGACNPAAALKALQTEDKVGTMLPCNFIVQEHGENKIEVSAIDPVASMQAIKNDELINIANEIKNKIINVIHSL